ncbi:MAG: hypothetical protein AAF726_00650 [Planctomycetota bacterium]
MSEPDKEPNATPDLQGEREQQAEHAEHDFTGPLSPPVRNLVRALTAVCVLLFLADFVVKRKIHVGPEKIPGFYAIYGFVGCAVLVLLAKEMRRVVMRSEDYYDPPTDAGSGEWDPGEGEGR